MYCFDGLTFVLKKWPKQLHSFYKLLFDVLKRLITHRSQNMARGVVIDQWE